MIEAWTKADVTSGVHTTLCLKASTTLSILRSSKANMSRSMRIVPVSVGSDPGSPKAALGVVVGLGPAIKESGNAEEGNGAEAPWLYELQLAQELPIVNISKTPASTLLPTKMYQPFEHVVHKLNSVLLTLFRISLVAFAGLLVVPTKILRPWIPLIFVVSSLPPLLFSSFYSLEVLALLPRYYEFWFISTLNALAWIGLGVIFGDLRALTCLTLWFNFQTVVAIDANFRTFPAAVKSTVISGPAMVALVVCCAYSTVVDSSFPTVHIGAMPFQSRQVVVFTASTIAIFMFKKAYTKRRRILLRLRDRQSNPAPTPGRHTIPCVLILARLRLRPRGSPDAETDSLSNAGAAPARSGPSSFSNSTNCSRVQQLQLAPTTALVVDARKTLLSRRLVLWLSSRRALTALHVTGAVGLSTTAVSWIMMFQHFKVEWTDELHLVVAVIAAIASFAFVATSIFLAQRDLLRLLVWNFDVLFSAFQGTALAVCLLDLLQWQATSSFAVIAWWLWFHCLLVLDAITPSFTRHLHIRRRFGLAAVVVVLAVAGACALELLIGNGGVFVSRLLWSVRVVNDTGFEVHTSTLAVQRTVTIVGWFPRLLVELATGRSDQLLFIRRQVEYFSPYATFSEPAAPSSREATTSRRRLRF